jgi:hypothetical protein
MRPAFRRGWEGEGKPNRRPGAGQRARSARHTGAAILLWEREGKALGVPTQSGNGGDQPPSAASRHRNGALARRDADGRSASASKARKDVAAKPQLRQRAAAQTDRARPARQRGESVSGSARKRRALRSAERGAERVLKSSRSFAAALHPLRASDRHRLAGTPQAARWSKPAQAGLRNRARCGLARRRRLSTADGGSFLVVSEKRMHLTSRRDFQA